MDCQLVGAPDLTVHIPRRTEPSCTDTAAKLLALLVRRPKAFRRDELDTIGEAARRP